MHNGAFGCMLLHVVVSGLLRNCPPVSRFLLDNFLALGITFVIVIVTRVGNMAACDGIVGTLALCLFFGADTAVAEWPTCQALNPSPKKLRSPSEKSA